MQKQTKTDLGLVPSDSGKVQTSMGAESAILPALNTPPFYDFKNVRNARAFTEHYFPLHWLLCHLT